METELLVPGPPQYEMKLSIVQHCGGDKGNDKVLGLWEGLSGGAQQSFQ